MICSYGCGQPANFVFKNGRGCCGKTSSSCPNMKKINGSAVSAIRQKLGNSVWKNGHPKGMQGKSPYNKGKTYEEIYGKEKANLLKLQHSKRASVLNVGRAHTEESKEKIRLHALERHRNGWDNKAGRCKKYKYASPVAGSITLDGTWELKTAIWLDSKGYVWKRNKERFEYIKPNGQTGYYTPDFYVEEWKSYLEVKGYKTQLDECKWSQFTNKLTVWYKADIVAIENEIGGLGERSIPTDY